MRCVLVVLVLVGFAATACSGARPPERETAESAGAEKAPSPVADEQTDRSETTDDRAEAAGERSAEAPLRTDETAAATPTDAVPPARPPCEGWSAETRRAELEESARSGALLPAGSMAARIRDDRATIWTLTRGTADVRVELSAGPECEPTTTDWVTTTESGGFGTQIDVEGLFAGTLYRYVIEVDDGAGPPQRAPAGWFTTAPLTDRPVRIALSADIAHRDKYYGLFDELALSDADLYLALGDWPYADSGGDAHTLDEFRAKHIATRDHPAIRMFTRAMGVHAIWDDHEVVNNWDARVEESEPERVRAALKAWHEFFPVAAAHDGDGEIYRHHAWGPNIDVFLLDLRSHRASNLAPDTEEKTMLGETQRAWLLEALSESTAAFKLVVTSVPLAWGTTGVDHWVGFRHERELLLDHIVENQIDGVVFLTADQHWLAVHHLPEGMKVFQVGALAQVPRKPSDAVPEWVVLQHKALNFGLLDYTPGSPPTLTFTAVANETPSRSDTGDPTELYRETVQAGRGTIEVAPALEHLEWTLRGAHTFVGRGAHTIDLAPPGEYTIEWRSLIPGQPLPPESTRVLDDGGRIRFAADAPAGESEVSLRATFDTVATAATPRALPEWDRGAACGEDQSGPDWQIVDGTLRETSNCYDADDEPSEPAARDRYRALDKARRRLAVPKRGTWMSPPGVELEDGWVGVHVAPYDNDAFGLMYGMQDGREAYYRVSFDAQREYARLVRVVDGEWEVLAEDRTFEIGRRMWHGLVVERIGSSHRVLLDGDVVLEAEDDVLGGGGVALYAWGMDDVRFDNLTVRAHGADASPRDAQ